MIVAAITYAFFLFYTQSIRPPPFNKLIHSLYSSYNSILNFLFKITSNMSRIISKSSSVESTGMMIFAIFPDSIGIDCLLLSSVM